MQQRNALLLMTALSLVVPDRRTYCRRPDERPYRPQSQRADGQNTTETILTRGERELESVQKVVFRHRGRERLGP
jgi:hypothetical protein